MLKGSYARCRSLGAAIVTNCLCSTEPRHVDVLYPWTKALTEDQVDLLFINTGAHVHDFKLYKQVLHQAADYLKKHYQGKLVFRTTVPGHSKCGEWDRPLGESADGDPYPRHGWALYRHICVCSSCCRVGRGIRALQ